MKLPWILLCLAFSLATANSQNQPLRVFIRGGPKTHGPGQHDHPRFMEEWKALLNARGAKADGAMNFPTEAQLDQTDVLVLYAAEAGTIAPESRKALEKYLARGGGIVAIHDAVCGTDAHWFKTIIGGAWEHRHSKWFEGDVAFYYQDDEHPITRGASNFDFDDEIYWDLHLMEGVKILAASYAPDRRNSRGGRSYPSVYQIVPQMWTYEKDNYRAFVSIPGHLHKTFNLPHYRAVLLRGIAWAGKRDADSLASREELASLRYPEGGPTSPEKAGELIKTHPDFTISLVASEPLLQKPISHDWDPAGRLWVAETPEYPAKVENRPARDRISILEDSDGDGRMDRKSVFFEGLDLVTSLVFHRDGVIVSQAPDIYFLRDQDGDGKAEKKETLYTGFGIGDSHAVISNLRWGMDGWVYATIGYSRGEIKSGDGSKTFGRVTEGVLRFKPDGSAMEQVSSKGGNTWGMDFAPDGEIFFSQANGNHINHVVLPEGVLARARVGRTPSFKTIEDHRQSIPIRDYTKQAYVQIDHVGGFTAASGATIYDGGAWPAKYHGTYYVAEPTVNLVHQDVLRPEGPTYLATKERTEEWLASGDLWFRPIHQRVGPDGALYVLDFYNQAAVHNDTRGPRHGPRNAAMRPDRDHYFGRIWKIQHRQAASLSRPALASASTAELVRQLEHSNGWVRMTAHRLLREKGSAPSSLQQAAGQGIDRLLSRASAEVRRQTQQIAGQILSDREKGTLRKSLEQMATGSTVAYARLHAFWILHQLDSLSTTLAATGLKDSDAAVRKNVARIIGEDGAKTLAGSTLERALVPLLDDADPRARLQGLTALGGLASLESATVDKMLALYPKLEDAWSQAAFLATAGRQTRPFLERALVANSSLVLTGVVAQLSLVTADKPAEAAELIALVGSRENAPLALRESALAGLNQGLKGDTKIPNSSSLETQARKIFAGTELSLKAALLPLIGRLESQQAFKNEITDTSRLLLERVRSTAEPDERRLQMAGGLLSVRQLNPEIVTSVSQLLSSEGSPAFRHRLIELLGSYPDRNLADQLISIYPALGPAEQEVALVQLLKRPEWAERMVASVENRSFPLASLGPSGVHRLRTYPEKGIAQRASTAIAAIQGPEIREKNELIAKLSVEVEKPGNSAKGHEVFSRNCASCHKYNAEGRDLAPDLTGMGAHGVRELLVHILDPNRVVEPNFVSYSIETRDDQIYDGIIARENRNVVVVRNASGDIEVPRDNIRSRRNTTLSLMPSGFEALGGEALRDLLHFLTAGEVRFRVLDLKEAFTVDSRRGMFASQERTNEAIILKKFGLVRAGDVPFELVHPARTGEGKNVLVLKGGQGFARSLPSRVEISGQGLRASQLHILGGVGGWAHPFGEHSRTAGLPVARMTVIHEGGAREEFVLKNGVEIADYNNASADVPGSKAVPDLVQHGQVRMFSRPLKNREPIQKIVLESLESAVAPAFLAVTAEVISSGEQKTAQDTSPAPVTNP